ncbi:MAG: type II CAAX endopeptidase family protein [Candidatus Thermoplasmatota archaeon]|nr:type II CAAX endopeptidase family protein [Candidatus Thermoplasmatota archaeon]
MDGSVGKMGVNLENQEDSVRRSVWKSWAINLTFCFVWIAVTSTSIVLLMVASILLGLPESYSIHLSVSLSYLLVIPLTLLFMHVDGQLSDLTGMLTIDSTKSGLILLVGIPILVTVIDLIMVIGYGIGYELAFGVPEVETDIGVDWGSGPVALGMAVASTVIIAPIAEELMFRGYVLDSIRKMHGDWVAVVISALIFGLVHFEPYTIGLAAIGGLIYGYLRVRTGSLWPSIIGHMLWNGIALVVTYL